MSAPAATRSQDIALGSDDGHAWSLLARVPEQARASLLWLPAMGVAARHYLPFAEALAARGTVYVHEWRGNGSSSLRAGRTQDWGYRELLASDLPASQAAVETAAPRLPRILGGHSLGGQLACCRLGMAPDSAQSLWMVAGGAPYWRAFPNPTRWWLPLAYRFTPWLADRYGALPGRRIGFGGQEARGVIRDWSRSALSGRYAASGLDVDLEAAMARIAVPIRALVKTEDWLAPVSSLRFLLSKMPRSTPTIVYVGAETGRHADHFSWMRQPERTVAALLA
jgi:predicted alpha/beta hydrolase